MGVINFLYIVLYVFLLTSAQLLLKAAMNKIGHFSFELNNISTIFFKISTNRFMIIALACYGIGFIVWLLVLSNVNVNIAYPMVSMGYILNAIAAHYLMGENLSSKHIFGIAIILGGVYLVAV